MAVAQKYAEQLSVNQKSIQRAMADISLAETGCRKMSTESRKGEAKTDKNEHWQTPKMSGDYKREMIGR